MSRSLQSLEAAVSSVTSNIRVHFKTIMHYSTGCNKNFISLKEKYHLRLELRQGEPAISYTLQLWDDDGHQLWADIDDPHEHMIYAMASVGLW